MKKGIAMVTLVVVISVMLILVSVITVSGINASNTAKRLSFASEIKMLQDSVNSYRTNNNNELPMSEFITIDLTNASYGVKKQFQDNSEDITNDKVYLNKIDYTKLDVISLSRGHSESQDDIYVVSGKSGVVYYAKGLKIGNDTYYTLTDDLKSLLGFNSKADEVLSDNAVICEMSNSDWTNNNIDVSIKVPKEYNINSVNIENNVIDLDDKVVDERYNIYNIEIQNNCSISVNYTDKKGVAKTSKFSVTNIDKEVPNIESNKITKANINKKYIQIKGIDLQSGIKIIKYDTDKINNDEVGRIYFNSNGIELKDNVIEVDSDVPYVTVYVQDNAGNYQIFLINN